MIERVDDAVRDVHTLLEEAGFTVVRPRSPSYPSLLAANSDRGLAVVDVVAGWDDSMTHLNQKVAQLRLDIEAIERVPAQRLVVTVAVPPAGANAVHVSVLSAKALASNLAGRPIAASSVDALTSFFAPRAAIAVPQRGPLNDAFAGERAEARLELDREQSELARRQVDDVLFVKGPPGSGKSLVLAARAAWLATLHPSWRIVIVCYNRLLVPYLEQLVSAHDNVTVTTFGRFAHGLGFRVSLSDEDQATADVARALPHVEPTYDALLIDEWQDFMDPWTRLALKSVVPGRGGATVAGDPQQALYRDADPRAAFVGHSVETATLRVPYRSTRQILEVTSALDGSMVVAGLDRALAGPPVDLIWAENASATADAIVREVTHLIASGTRSPADIGVLVTRKWLIGKIVGALRAAAQPVSAVYANAADKFDLLEQSVKVMTVHSAKGYEFSSVFLVGLEHLPDPDGGDRSGREGRSGYVGMTRARDQLVLTYSKENLYLDRIRSLPDTLVKQWVWPDDFPEES